MKNKLNLFFLFVGLRYAWPSGKRFFASFIAILSMLGITLGVAALIIVLSVMNGLESELKEQVLSTVSHALLTSDNSANSKYLDENYDYSKYLGISNVLHAAPVITDEIMLQSNDAVAGGIIYGINPNEYPEFDLVRTRIGEDTFNYLESQGYEIIIGSGLASSLNVQVGDSVRLISPSNIRYTPLGRMPAQRIFKIIGISNLGVTKADNAMIIGHISDVRRLVGIPKNKISGIRFWLNDPFLIDDFISEAKDINSDISFIDWRKTEGEFFQSVAMEKLMMSLMLLLIIVVAVFNMFSSLIMVVSNKTAEIAILRTIGTKSRTILAIFVIEGAISGVIGAILGSVIGIVAVYNIDFILSFLGLNFYLGGGFGFPCELRMYQVFLITSITILMSFLVTLFPAWRASLTRPAQSLRYE